MALETLDHMARGGIHDHLGGGFHRYSTDAQWRVPHFEKMLYDQASTRAPTWKPHKPRESRRSARWRARSSLRAADLTAPNGGFFAAEDADSGRSEGRFYTWTRPSCSPPWARKAACSSPTSAG